MKIKGLYETHLFVEDLDRSIDFYKNILGLKQCLSSIHNVLYALNKPTSGAINLTYSDEGLTIQSPFEGEYMTMATGTEGRLVKDSIQPLQLRSRYIIGNQAVVFPKPVIKGVFDVVKKSELLKGDEDGIALKVVANGEIKTRRTTSHY